MEAGSSSFWARIETSHSAHLTRMTSRIGSSRDRGPRRCARVRAFSFFSVSFYGVVVSKEEIRRESRGTHTPHTHTAGRFASAFLELAAEVARPDPTAHREAGAALAHRLPRAVPTGRVSADGRFSVDESSHLQDVTDERTRAHRVRLLISANPAPLPRRRL